MRTYRYNYILQLDMYMYVLYREGSAAKMAVGGEGGMEAADANGACQLTLSEAAARLQRLEQHAQEMEAMYLLAQRTRAGLLARHAQLLEENDLLHKRLGARRMAGSATSTRHRAAISASGATGESLQGCDGSSLVATQPVEQTKEQLNSTRRVSKEADPNELTVYDWVCEITKLSDVGTVGWMLRYSEAFLTSLTEEERRYVMGTEPVTFKPRRDPGEEGERGSASGGEDDAGEIEGASGSRYGSGDAEGGSGRLDDAAGWDGAVVAVLGLFDKGKTFVLNHLTDLELPSGKKVTAANTLGWAQYLVGLACMHLHSCTCTGMYFPTHILVCYAMHTHTVNTPRLIEFAMVQVSTKGLSFKHVDVEGTRFVVLDSEGSYAPVKVP